MLGLSLLSPVIRDSLGIAWGGLFCVYLVMVLRGKPSQSSLKSISPYQRPVNWGTKREHREQMERIAALSLPQPEIHPRQGTQKFQIRYRSAPLGPVETMNVDGYDLQWVVDVISEQFGVGIEQIVEIAEIA